MFDRLERYCSAFGPSGCEDEIRRMIIEDIDGHCDYRTDRTGNLLCFKSGRKPRANRLLVSAHMDEVGLMIDYITPEGITSAPSEVLSQRTFAENMSLSATNAFPAL